MAKSTTTVDFKHPPTVDGKEILSLDFRRPKVKDRLYAEKQSSSRAEQEISVFASCAGVAPEVIEELDMADYVAIQKEFEGFLS